VQEQCRVEEEKIASLASSAERLKSDSSFGKDDVCIYRAVKTAGLLQIIISTNFLVTAFIELTKW